MASIKDVAKQAGVSPATVSRVTNGYASVSQATRDKVQAAMDALGYVPDASAQALSSKRTNTLGMVVSQLDGPFYGPVLSAVAGNLRKRKKHLLIACGHGNRRDEAESIEYLIDRKVDGLILLTEHQSSEALVSLSERLPIYLINQEVEGLEHRNIVLDNFGGARDATRYLIEQGHRKIACIGGQDFKLDADARVEGYKQALRDAGLAIDPKLIQRTRFEAAGGQEAMRNFAMDGACFSGLVTGNDESALGVYAWCAEQGVSIPKDLSIVGFDDIFMSRFVNPPLTTVHFPLAEMAEACSEFALNEIYEGAPATRQVFSTRLVIRDSVAYIDSTQTEINQLTETKANV